LALGVLAVARLLYPRPRDLEPVSSELEARGFPRVFWLYLIAVALIAAGFADFPLIAYHFQKAATVPPDWIPVLYAVAMGVDALAALVFGRAFDRIGLSILILAVLLSALFAPLVFLGGFSLALVGMALWGIGMGAQESIMRAAVAGMVPSDRRGTAYGVFYAGYGVVWFLGSVLMGFLYDTSLPALIVFSVVIQMASIPMFLVVRKRLAN
jgi:predicted MFS family arabinose efflux permease